ALVQALIRSQRWTVPFAAAYARNISNSGARVLTLSAVAEVAGDEDKRQLLKEALAVAQQLRDDADDVISTLATRLGAAGLIGDALATGRRLKGQSRASVLAAILSAVPASGRPAIVPEATEAAMSSGPLFRSGAVAAVAPYLDELDLRELIADCNKIP